jgi:hypothetical protein
VNLVACAGTVPAGVKRILVKRLEVVVLGRLLGLLGPNPDLSSAEPEDRTALRAGWTIHRSAAEYMPQTSAEQALYRDAAVPPQLRGTGPLRQGGTSRECAGGP